MKRRYRLYLDAAFWARLADRRRFEARRLTYRFLNRACVRHDILVSPLVLKEIDNTPNAEERRIIKRQLTASRPYRLGTSFRVERIAEELQAMGGFGKRMLADLTHVGYAVIGRADALVTWDRRTLACSNVRVVTQAWGRRERMAVPMIGLPAEVAKWLGLEM